MAIFSRRIPPPEPQDHYSKYRPLVREDFTECCAYCLLHELLAGGENNFQLDHFRPKSLAIFANFVEDFYNLYYACSVCNRYKSNSWPRPELEALGYGFVDFCAENGPLRVGKFERGFDNCWKVPEKMPRTGCRPRQRHNPPDRGRRRLLHRGIGAVATIRRSLGAALRRRPFCARIHELSV